jgi:hypothetical protein
MGVTEVCLRVRIEDDDLDVTVDPSPLEPQTLANCVVLGGSVRPGPLSLTLLDQCVLGFSSRRDSDVQVAVKNASPFNRLDVSLQSDGCASS